MVIRSLASLVSAGRLQRLVVTVSVLLACCNASAGPQIVIQSPEQEVAVAQIRSARRSLLVKVHSIDERRLLHSLIDAARRGIRLVVLARVISPELRALSSGNSATVTLLGCFQPAPKDDWSAIVVDKQHFWYGSAKWSRFTWTGASHLAVTSYARERLERTLYAFQHADPRYSALGFLYWYGLM